MKAALLLTIMALMPAIAGAAPHPGEGQDVGKVRARRPAAWEMFTLDGYFRTRAGLLHNLDLDRGGTPSTGEPLFPIPIAGGQVLGSADARLRLDLGIEVGDVVRARVRVDALDGLVLGSTPTGYPGTRWTPTPWASLGQQPQTAGVNALVSSIRLKEAWGEVLMPVGLLRFGRMQLPRWGLGVVTGRGTDLDDDWDDLVDRVSFATSFADHLLGVSFDINAVGPTSANATGGATRTGQALDLELQDNVYTLSLAFARLHDEAAIRRRRAASDVTASYGAYLSWRWQVADFPTFYAQGIAAEEQEWTAADAVARRMNAIQADGWFRLDAGPMRVEVEAVYGFLKVNDPSTLPTASLPALTSNQFGGVLEVEGEAVADRVFLQLGVAVASGDPAPGLGVAPPVGQATSQPGDFDGPQFALGTDNTINNFRFHPNYRVDLVFWRHIAGTVTDAFLVRPQLTLRAGPALQARISGVISTAMAVGSTPGNDRLWGGEVDIEAEWTPVSGFVARAQYGLFLPGPALRNLDLDLGAKPAQVARVILAVTL